METLCTLAKKESRRKMMKTTKMYKKEVKRRRTFME